MKQYNNGHIRATVQSDFANLEKNLRYADKLEFETTNYSELGFVDMMSLALIHTPMKTAVLNNGDIAFILGVNKIEDDGGFVWLLGTKAIEDISIEFVRNTKKVFSDIRKSFKYLKTHALEFEPKRHRWLKWMGFQEVSRTPARGRLQLPFINYETI